MAGHKNVR